MRILNLTAAVLAVVATMTFTTFANAQQQLRIEVVNLQGTGGYYFTPLFVGFHDGSVDLFSAGESAGDNGNPSPIQALAEGGDVAGLSAMFNNSGLVTAPAGFAGAPVFDPGDSGALDITVDPTERFFSFASMLIPSNDVFFGNGNQTAYELFDSNGDFVGPLEITINGSNLYDAGTEILDSSVAAFVPGGNGGPGDAGGPNENGLIRLLSTGAGIEDFNNKFVGVPTAAGTTITNELSGSSPIARIRITAVPEPSGIMMLGLGLVGLATGIRRRRSS